MPRRRLPAEGCISGEAVIASARAAFGLGEGILWASVGANQGASTGFWIARRLGRSDLGEFFGPRLGAIDRNSAAAGFHGVLTLRLLPLAPFSLLYIAFGPPAIRWTDCALATVIGTLPGTVIQVQPADALLSGSASASHEAPVRALGAGLLLDSLSLGTRWVLSRRARHAS